MREFTPTLYTSDMVQTADHVNLEVQQLKGTWNGNLDGNNILPNSIDSSLFVSRVEATDGTFDISRGQFSDYYSGFESDTPLGSINLRTNTVFAHGIWNEITSTNFNRIDFTALKEGVLYGDFIIDWERRRGHQSVASYLAGDDATWNQEFGIFFDDKLISTSGPLFPRRDTLCLPFHTEVSSGTHSLELKYKAESFALGASYTTYDQTFSIYTVGLHCRNLFA